MNELHTQVCFDALSVLNNVQYIESVCNLCGASHFTGNCPEIKQGTYVPDTPQQSFSRSSVPNGLLVMDSEDGGTCVITSQKFAKGTRFGPLQAPLSCFPIKGSKFPLIIFPTQHFKEEIADIQPLFNARNTYLDTTDENKCNWMIHVNTAKYSNEQNLICYQENYEIFYAAIQDIELGDILKVWYSPIYASTIGAKLLDPSPYDICNNILRQVSIDYGIKIDDNNVLESSSPYSVYEEPLITGCSDKDREISLPPVISLMKISSPNYSNYTNTPTPTTSHTSPFAFEMNMVDTLGMNDDLGLNFGPSTSSHVGGGTFIDCDTGTAIVAASDVLLQQDLSEISSHTIMKMQHHESDVEIGPSVIAPPTTVETGTDSVKFACEVCSRKYATKLTLEKHLRTHDLYLCIVCDKVYHALHEMQEHDCYKKKNKTRPLHCNVCLKLLSNSWSLNRHMKIHRNSDEKALVPPGTEEVKPKEEVTDETVATSSSSSEQQNFQQTVISNQGTQQNAVVTPPLKPKVPGKRLEEPMECIVCRRPFKNPNALDKHLRSVHTVYTKDPKYVQETRNKVVLTNNSAPIKPSIAKALASKLTKKKEANSMNNNQQASSSPKQQSENDPNKRTDNNTIIIISNVELTNGNMFDTQQLLNNSQQNPSINTIQLVNDKVTKLMPLPNDDLGLQQPQYDPLSPVSVHNLDETDYSETIMNSETPVEIIDVPKMIVIKKPKKVDVANNGETGGDETRKDEPAIYNCDDCKKTFAKKYQLKRHQETHELVFYTCAYCDKAPLKARSSLKKHFSREHSDKSHEWNTNNFISKQILRDEAKLKELRKKYFEKKRLRIMANDKFLENCKNMHHTDETSTSVDTVESLDLNEDNNFAAVQQQQQQKNLVVNGKRIKKKMTDAKLNCDSKTTKTIILNNNVQNHHHHHQINGGSDQSTIVLTAANNSIYYQNNNNSMIVSKNGRYTSVKKQKLFNGNSWEIGAYQQQQPPQVSGGVGHNREIYYINTATLNQSSSNSTGGSTHSDESVISKSDEHEMIDNLFLENLDNLLDPLHENEYNGDDDHAMQSVNYIQETFQNSFDKIQEKLDADLEVGHEQLKWEDTLKSDDSSDEIMSNKLLGIDENVMLI